MMVKTRIRRFLGLFGSAVLPYQQMALMGAFRANGKGRRLAVVRISTVRKYSERKEGQK